MKDKRKYKIKFKKEIKTDANGNTYTVMHPLPPEDEDVKYPNKRNYIRTAKELYYPDYIIEKLKKAKSEEMALSIMAEGRHTLDRFDYGQKDADKYTRFDKTCHGKNFINMPGGRKSV